MKNASQLFVAMAAILLSAQSFDAQAHDSAESHLEASRVNAMQKATLAFLATLDDAQREKVASSLNDNAARTRWSNLPTNLAPPAGLAVADMSTEQRKAFHALMSAAFSSQGYLKTTTIIWHEDVLHDISAADLDALPEGDPIKAERLPFLEYFDSEKFYISVFGDPDSENWGWLVTGHHYAANFTISNGKVAFTPLFIGAHPQIVPEGRYAGWRILQHEADRAFALVTALEKSQLETAIVSSEVDDNVFAGKGRVEWLRHRIGIKASGLNPHQLRLLNGLINEYLGNAADAAADRQRRLIEQDGLDALHFAWWGPTDDPNARYMYRIHGPSILIDYVREMSADGGFNHVHTIVRDPSNDYGSQWLKLHYEEAHQD